MPKLLIIDGEGNILRAINLPYEGKLKDVSAMDDEQFEALSRNLQSYKVIEKVNGDLEVVQKE